MQETPSLSDLKSVSPAFERYTAHTVFDGLWKRPQLPPRDRSVVTLSVLIARGQVVEMPFHFRRALDNGAKPAELSEIIAHLAFYSGWANATAAAGVAKRIFDERGIGADQVPPADVTLLPLNEAAEKQRAQAVAENFGEIAPGVVQYTADVLFAIFGYALGWHRVTEAWSRSAHSSQTVKPRRFRITSTARWTTGSPRKKRPKC